MKSVTPMLRSVIRLTPRAVVALTAIVALAGQAAAASPGLSCDYSENGACDAADYTVWRDHRHQNCQLPYEGGIRPRVVDAANIYFWKSRFGATSGPRELQRCPR